MTTECVYASPRCCGNLFKDETCSPLKISVERHCQSVTWGDIDESSITDHEKWRGPSPVGRSENNRQRTLLGNTKN